MLDRVNLRFYAPTEQTASLEFYDAMGKRVYQRDVAVSKGEQTLTFMLDRYPVGTYQVILRGQSRLIRGRFLHLVR